ncbi:MAG: hypothetical protein NC390_01260 [Fusobacterium sp.]|nr:hypothetical protein [Fusobacterium sp.]
MSELREKVYQMFILGTEGGGYEEALRSGLGGIIFFTKDILSPEQIKNVTDECRKLALIPPFLSIDQEGGRVERTENIHGGKKYLSARYAFEKGILKEQTEQIAQELCSYGMNLNFAPCIDVNTNSQNPIIGERAFSDKTGEVIEAEKIVSRTYEQNGIIPCVKHFPGHGDANVDSHLGLPKIDIPLDEMERLHIAPFKSAILGGIDMVMVAHLHCTCFDKDVIPTSMSDNALRYLREKLGFKGVAISDDMIMKGVAEQFTPLEACVKGIKAGLNMFIYRNSTPDIIETIEKIAEMARNDAELRDKINDSFNKIIELKKSRL